MQKSLLVAFGAAFSIFVVSTSSAQSGTYAFGDEPYRLDWGYDPEIASGCWRWNWQQYQWEDHCPRYVYPKAYMYYGRPGHVVVRTKG